MSYCRLFDGDVYMYPAMGEIVCDGCKLSPLEPSELNEIMKVLTGIDMGLAPTAYGSVKLKTTEDAYWHLLAHRQEGHKVPQYAIDRLIEESGVLN